jgi:hypothetical protein
MKRRFTTSNLADRLVAIVLALVPFHAFLTVWAAAVFGHYTAWRVWDDALLFALMGVTITWLVRDEILRTWFTRSLLVRLIGLYAVLTVLLGSISYSKGEVTAKALGYGMMVNLRFLAWFLAVLLSAQRSPWLRRAWPTLVMIPASIVIVFAVLQYVVLPHDFLVHFGYHNITTIAPIETINNNVRYIRVQSTLRGANPLGAYFVVILLITGVLGLRGRRKLTCGAVGVLGLLALYASGSRSAWIGTVLSLVVLGALSLHDRAMRVRAGLITGGLVIVIVALVVVLRTNATVQNALFHTQANSTATVSSNDAHASALRNGVHDVLHQPFGDGPGTAGPASEYNAGRQARIAEDYYVQIAQETGWLGLLVLMGIFGLVAVELYQLRSVSRLALGLFASFIGLAVVGLLSHAWTDDTLAYLWWGLAGIALGLPRLEKVSEKPQP